MLARITKHSEDHFGADPDKVNWGDVGTLEPPAHHRRRLLIEMLRRAKGATITEMVDATGWQLTRRWMRAADTRRGGRRISLPLCCRHTVFPRGRQPIVLRSHGLDQEHVDGH